MGILSGLPWALQVPEGYERPTAIVPALPMTPCNPTTLDIEICQLNLLPIHSVPMGIATPLL
jgi:hypothetical protein